GKGKGSVIAGDEISDISSDLLVTLQDGTRVDIDLSDAGSVQDVIKLFAAANRHLTARVSNTGFALVITDSSTRPGTFSISARNGSDAASDLGIVGIGVAGVINGTDIAAAPVTLDGRTDADTIVGSDGDDILTGAGGSDNITGGLGIDTLKEADLSPF